MSNNNVENDDQPIQEVWHRFTRCRVFWISHGGKYLSSTDVSSSQADLRRLVRSAQRQAQTGDYQAVEGGRWLTSGDNTNTSVVLTCDFQKDIDSPVGTLTIGLRPTVDWSEAIQTDDLLIVFMAAQGEDVANGGDAAAAERMVTMALVDSVHDNGSGESPETSYTVTARDLGKVLLETSTVFDPAFAQVDNAFLNAQFIQRFQEALTGSPLEMVLTVYDLFFNPNTSGNQLVNLQWRFPGAESVSLASMIDIRNFVQAPLFGYFVPNSIALAEHGNLWNLLRSLCNEVVNEFFIDLRDLEPEVDDAVAAVKHAADVTASYLDSGDVSDQKSFLDKIASGFEAQKPSDAELTELNRLSPYRTVAALVFRQLPYDSDTFMSLPFRVVYDTEVVGEASFARTSQEVYNFFRLRSPVLPATMQELVYGIRVNTSSIKAHGLRRYEAETQFPFVSKQLSLDFMNGGAQQSTIAQTVYDYYVGLLALWNTCNERMLAGTLTTHLRPDIRVGTRLRFVRRRHGVRQTFDFYVQSVHHHFGQKEGTSSSTFRLVRGVRQDATQRLEANLHWTENGARFIGTDTNGPFDTMQATGIELTKEADVPAATPQQANAATQLAALNK